MTSYQWWLESAGGSFSDPNNWESGTAEPPQGPPGPGDIAGIVNEPYTPTANGITVNGGTATVSQLAFEGTVTVTGASLAATGEIIAQAASTIASAALLTLTGNSTLAGPVGNTGTGVEIFATLDIEGASTVTGYGVNSFETLLVENGLVSARDFTASGFASAFSGFIPGSVDIGAAGTISDTLGILGITTTDIASMTVGGGGKWINQGLGIGTAGQVSLSVSGGSTVSTGGGTAYPGAPALVIGGNGTTTTSVTVNGAGSAITDANDAWIGQQNTTTISLESGGLLEIDGTLDAATAKGGTDTVQIGGGGSRLHVGGNATLGDLGAFTATIATGGSLDADGALIAANAASVNVSLDIAGGTLSAGGDAIFGASGTATVAVSAGGELSVGGALTVGGAGSASLDINAAALDITGQAITAGATAGGNGDISVESTSVSDASGNIAIGNAGTGSLSVNTGGSISANDLDVGQVVTGNGNVVFSGGNGNFSDVNLGASGAAALEVTAKGTLETTSFTAATGKVAVPAAVTIDGKGVLQVASQLILGGAGEATLELQSGGTVSANEVIIGNAKSGNGALLFDSLTTTTSDLIYGSLLVVGSLGTADLSLANAGTVTQGALQIGTVEIGLSSGADGTLSITGTHAALSAATLDIGGGAAAGGVGLVSLAAGGLLSAATATIWSKGSLVLAGGTLAGTAETSLGNVSGYGAIAGSLANGGTVTASGGALTLDDAVSGSGTFAVSAGTLDLRQGAVSTQTVTFEAGAGRLQTEALGATQATIDGFTFGDSILLAGTLADSGTWAGGELTLDEGAGAVGTLAMAGAFSANSFAVSNDGTNTTIEMACFAAGTGITTATGRVPVEALRVGERVPTVSGRLATVRWIGHRALDLQRHPHPENVMPVRVRAGAFGEGTPARDLVLSPDHAVLVEGTLIPVRHLINGVSVTQDARTRVTYWHVELDRHDVLLAEGAACESYLDTGNRHAFEGEAALDLHPDFAQARSMAIWRELGCAEIATEPGDRRLRAAHTALLRGASGHPRAIARV